MAALSCTFLPGQAKAGQVLDVVPSEDPGIVDVWVRDAQGATPIVTIDESAIELSASAPADSSRFKPLLMVFDSSNINEERLKRVLKDVKGLAEREMNLGARLVMVADQKGRVQMLEDISHVGENAEAWKKFLAGSTLDVNPEPRKPFYSTIGLMLPKVLGRESGTKTKRVWAMVFSSLCMDPEAEPLKLDDFKGPVHLVTWDDDLSRDCLKSKKKWLESSANDKLKVHVVGQDDEAIKVAMAGIPTADHKITLSPPEGGKGIDYRGGSFAIDVRLPGAPDGDAWKAVFKEDILPNEWSRSAKIKAKKVRMTQVAVGFTVLLLSVLLGVTFKARASAVDFARWEAVGEAEDLAAPAVDPDAWNATIFQLTGAMPVITEAAAKRATQLGPDGGDDATAVQKVPKAAKKPAAAPPQQDQGDQANETVTTTAEQPQAPAPKSTTGMTVSMSVVDDGTAYEAQTPFEIGVLQDGKPVARKTKMFRKSFSVGRATDNRVVIQQDDTVHRYHVVIRPAVEGKEWWLEVSPTASNRTRLNGKDLRPGGRYRVPGRFRLQLGESTEVRGRLSKKKAA
tara:strand:+ start:1003 stop:2709 length:1707 start_codon:yes stop_codon:yes gene_type:complete